MAATNVVSNPIVVGGSMATSFKTQFAAAVPNAGKPTAGNYGTLFTLIVDRIRWVNPPASSNITIGDPISGLTLWSGNSNTAGVDIDEDFTASPRLWQDFEINSFPGGTIYIYTR